MPCIARCEEIVHLPVLWHCDLGGKDMLRLVKGRERIYLDRFWSDFAGDPSKFDEATRVHCAKLYAQPGAMQADFAQFQSIRQDTIDNAELSKSKRTNARPCLNDENRLAPCRPRRCATPPPT